MIFARVNLNVITKRFRRVDLKSWPNDWVPFVWNRPQQVPGYLHSGDLENLKMPKTEDVRLEARMSDRLKNLAPDDPLRKIFSLDHAERRKHREAFVQEHLKKMGLIHDLDRANSLEAKIINLTYILRQVLEYLELKKGRDRHIGHVKTISNCAKNRRYRYLCDLKELHEDRYLQLIDALNIEPKNNLINVPYSRPYRKIQMRKLAIGYALDLKERKVKEFMESLYQEKAEFEEYKKSTLEWIEEKQKQIKVIKEIY